MLWFESLIATLIETRWLPNRHICYVAMYGSESEQQIVENKIITLVMKCVGEEKSFHTSQAANSDCIFKTLLGHGDTRAHFRGFRKEEKKKKRVKANVKSGQSSETVSEPQI